MKKPGNRIKRWGFGPTFFFAAILFNSNALADYELFGRMSTDLISEPEPIKTTLSDWGEDFDGGERQWALAKVEAGFRLQSGIEVSVFSRALADLRMNEDAVRFYGKIARKEALKNGTSVPVKIEVNGFSGSGLRLGYGYSSNDWALSGGLSIFQANHLMAGQLGGQFSAIGDSDYNFDAEVDYAYYRDVIFKRPDISKASGLGWSADLALSWQPQNWLLSLRAEDLFARVKWEDAPFTVATASTDQKSFDEDGYAVFAPLLSGREGYRNNFFQDLDARYYLAAEHQWNHWRALARGQYQFGYGFAGVGVGYQFSNGTTVNGLYWPKHDLFGVELNHGSWAASVAVDQPEWQRMRSLMLGISYGY